MSDWIVLIGAPMVVAYVVYLFVFSPDPTQESHRERCEELIENSRFASLEENNG